MKFLLCHRSSKQRENFIMCACEAWSIWWRNKISFKEKWRLRYQTMLRQERRWFSEIEVQREQRKIKLIDCFIAWNWKSNARDQSSRENSTQIDPIWETLNGWVFCEKKFYYSDVSSCKIFQQTTTKVESFFFRWRKSLKISIPKVKATEKSAFYVLFKA